MSMRNLLLSAFCLTIFGALCLPKAWADDWNKSTTLTFSQPVEIPGMVLPAGTYVFKLAESSSDRNIVQIFNVARTHIFATILAVNNYRLTPTNHTVITFSERPANTPMALHAWFYPGDNYGQEFVYPRSEALALARSNHRPVLAMPSQLTTELNLPPAKAIPVLIQAPIVAVEPTGKEVPASTVVAASPAVEIASTAPAPERPASLPKTAGELPLLGLLGALLLGLGLGSLRLARQRARAI